ncbi:MAG: hypothetical protein RL087_744, partial [Pseudomonadota bacterium]
AIVLPCSLSYESPEGPADRGS